MIRRIGWLGLALCFQLSACGENAQGSAASGGSAGAGGAAGSNAAGKAGKGGAGDAGSAGASAGNGNAGGGGTGGTPSGTSSAADLARKLGKEPNFLIGMGNDLPGDYVWENSGIYTLPAALDIHYIYLTYGWEAWNEGGWFAYLVGAVDVEKGAVPMADVWALTGQGENNFQVLTDDAYMGPYWDAAKLLMQRYGTDLDSPAIVHVEPDFWAFAQQASGGDPAAIQAHLHPECSDLPGNLNGFGRCWVRLARMHAPKVAIGFHASTWAAPSAAAIGEFLNAVGAGETDFVAIDMLDRDAGCFEAAVLEQCQRGGEFYWDETNQTSPNFHEHLAWAEEVSDTMEKPILWWQLPFGVPSDTPGGTEGHYRDNRVKYLFEHVQEFVDTGGVGACFGVGSGGQTYITTDGGQFADAVTGYYANPVPLP